MKPILPKVSVTIEAKTLPKTISLNTPLTLQLEEYGPVSVHMKKTSRFRIFRNNNASIRLGILDISEKHPLKIALARHVKLRVRVVELVPKHLSAHGKDHLFVSVWADPDDMADTQPAPVIFSKSRINDPV